MATRQYIGARYVPKFVGEWNNQTAYESLSIVIHNNASYTSKKQVPAGVLPTNTEYWVQTGSYNGFINQLQNDITAISDRVTAVEGDVGDIETEIEKLKSNGYVTPEMFGAIGDGVTDDTVALQSAIDSGKPVVGVNNYKISHTLKFYAMGSRYDGIFFHILGKIISSDTDAIELRGCNCDLYFAHINGDNTHNGICIYPPLSTDTSAVTERNVIRVGEIKNFNNGILLKTEGTVKGVQYCKIYFNRIFACTNSAIKFDGISKGWLNQNLFFGGRLGQGVLHCVEAETDTDFQYSEIDGNVFNNVGFEGTSGDCIVLKNCKNNRFVNSRMAEQMGGTYWINMDGCRNNYFDGNMVFTIGQIRDVNNYVPLMGTADYRSPAWCKNEIVMSFAYTGTNTYKGPKRLSTYDGEIFIEDFPSNLFTVFNWQNISALDIGARLMSDVLGVGNGIIGVITAGGTITLPKFFGSRMTNITLDIIGAGNTTIKRFDGTTLATITTSSGEHIKRLEASQYGVTILEATKGI